MSSIGSVVGAASYQLPQKAAAAQVTPASSDPDHDGDNDAGVSKAQEAAEQSRTQSIRTGSGGIDTQA